MISDEEIISFYKQFDLLKKNFKQNKEYGFELMPNQFFLRVRHLPSQIYGLRVQAYFCYHLDYEITPSSFDCGDFKNDLGYDLEFKCSFIDEDNYFINCKQIRLWQDLDFYIIMTIDYSDYYNIKIKCYELRKKEMVEECQILNATPVHNIKDKATEFSSLGFSIKLGSEHYQRWEEKYLNKKFDINKIVQKSISRLNKESLLKKQEMIINQLEKKLTI